MSSTPRWSPVFRISSATANALVSIGEARATVERETWTPLIEEAIRQRARVRSTHYSTAIEGNRLTLVEAAAVLAGERVVFAGRERDVREVDHYWHAMLQVESWVRSGAPVSEANIRRLHAMVEHGGTRRKPTPYREAQNVIRNSVTREIVYLPPEHHDVAPMMAAFAQWISDQERAALPTPILAALAHYQFVTIHPFMDGNGRTARLLATWLLHRGGFGLRGFYSLEEFHARDLAAYYGSLAAHPHHNFYMGRAEADRTPWIDYFVSGVARVFQLARDEALRQAAQPVVMEPVELRQLDGRARRVLTLFARRELVTAGEIGALLPIGSRAVRGVISQWGTQGFLEIADPSNRARSYRLPARYRQYLDGLPAAAPAESLNL
jgi:Fic family protein